jgi:hypothetical protein
MVLPDTGLSPPPDGACPGYLASTTAAAGKLAKAGPTAIPGASRANADSPATVRSSAVVRLTAVRTAEGRPPVTPRDRGPSGGFGDLR